MWEIYAYQNADSLFGIFNAAATIHGSGDYMAAVAAVAFCGFIAALVAYAFAPEKLQGWKWLATVLLVFSVLIVPRVTVGVVDKTGGSAVKVVANVPFGVAFLGSVTSTVGHTLTGLFETAFQVIPGAGALPSELSYPQNGLMFGNRLIRETGNVVFRKTARNFNVPAATAGKVCVVEVEEIVPVGSLNPDCIHLPGVYVQRMIVGSPYDKKIEFRTVRERATA